MTIFLFFFIFLLTIIAHPRAMTRISVQEWISLFANWVLCVFLQHCKEYPIILYVCDANDIYNIAYLRTYQHRPKEIKSSILLSWHYVIYAFLFFHLTWWNYHHFYIDSRIWWEENKMKFLHFSPLWVYGVLMFMVENSSIWWFFSHKAFSDDVT